MQFYQYISVSSPHTLSPYAATFMSRQYCGRGNRHCFPVGIRHDNQTVEEPNSVLFQSIKSSVISLDDKWFTEKVHFKSLDCEFDG